MLPPEERLIKRVDVDVWNTDVKGRCGVSINAPNTLPVRAGDTFRIEVTANLNTYLHVFWITSNCEVRSLYPWNRFDWAIRPEEEKKVFLQLPNTTELEGYAIEPAIGIETVVVIARESKLDENRARLLKSWPGYPKGKLPSDPVKVFSVHISKRGVPTRGEETRGEPSLGSIDDPISKIRKKLLDSLDGFGEIHAVSFANKGRVDDDQSLFLELSESEEPSFLDQFAEEIDGHEMRMLKGIFVLGCAYKWGKIESLRQAEIWLRGRGKKCPVPCRLGGLHDYVDDGPPILQTLIKKVPELVNQCLLSGKMDFWDRKGDEPQRDERGRIVGTGADSRQIVGMTETGKRAWEEVRKFMKKHDPTLWNWAVTFCESS